MRRRKKRKRQRDDFEGKNKAFDEQRGALLSKATDEAKTEHDRLLDETPTKKRMVCAPPRRPH